MLGTNVLNGSGENKPVEKIYCDSEMPCVILLDVTVTDLFCSLEILEVP